MQRHWDISEYGACADGVTESTASIQRAIDACYDAGGGRVVCGPGRFLTGSLVLKSNVDLHLAPGCVLVGSTSVDDYDDFEAPGFRADRAPENNSKSLLRAVRAENVSITGPGTIDGAGLAFYDTDTIQGRFFRKPPTARPRMLMMYECSDIRIEDASFIDSPCWTFWLMKCDRITVRGIRMRGDQRMINNDGIDVDSCRDVTISDSLFQTGDDCIIVRAIDPMFEDPRPCEHVTVTNCVLDSACQGVRIGCPGDGVIRDAVFSNLVIRSDNNGIVFDNPKRYLRSPNPGSASVHNVVFSNITVDCRGLPLKIIVEEGIALPRLSDLSFSELRIRSGGACTVHGCPQTTIRNVRFSNMRIDTTGSDAIVCRFCDNVSITNVTLSNLPE